MLIFDNIPIKYQYTLPWIYNTLSKKNMYIYIYIDQIFIGIYGLNEQPLTSMETFL